MRGCVGYYLLSYISNENRFTIQIWSTISQLLYIILPSNSIKKNIEIHLCHLHQKQNSNGIFMKTFFFVTCDEDLKNLIRPLNLWIGIFYIDEIIGYWKFKYIKWRDQDLNPGYNIQSKNFGIFVDRVEICGEKWKTWKKIG
jgi:hypothetical protein